MKLNAASLFVAPALCLAGMIAAPAKAVTTNVKTTDNLINVARAAHPGDVLQLGAGTYSLNTPVAVPTGVTIAGASVDSTHVVFNIAGGSTTGYGFTINGGAQNVKITQLDIISNHGAISMNGGAGYKNIVITRNNIKYGGGRFPSGTLIFGISGTVKNDGLQITHNYMHDSPNTERNWDIWSATNANIDYNLFYNITDGGRLDCPGDNVSFSFNYGTNMHRMGQECYIGSDSNLVCQGNVFYSYVNPYYDTEGMSIVGGVGEVDLINNYLSASMAAGSGWGDPDGGGLHRFGFGIEATGAPGYVKGNTFVGRWCEVVAADMKGVTVSNNSVYGGGIWSNFAGEPGHFGNGSVIVSNNLTDSNVAHAPAPPKNTFAGPKN